MKNQLLLEGKMHTELEIALVAAQFLPQRVFESISLQLLSNSESPSLLSPDVRCLSASPPATHCCQKPNIDQFFLSTSFGFLVLGRVQ